MPSLPVAVRCKSSIAGIFPGGKKRCLIGDWSPVNGDSLVFKWDEPKAVGIYVHPVMYGEGTRDMADAKPGIEARYHQLTSSEREAVIIHKHEVLQGSFWEWEKAASVFGIGLRSHLYWAWLQKQELLGWLTEFLERVGMGFTIFRFQAGNPESERKVREIVESFSNAIAIAYPGYNDQKYKDIERVEVQPSGVDNLLRVVQDFYGNMIRRMILGEVVSSEIGSVSVVKSTSENQKAAFERIIRFDSENLAETLNRDLLPILMRYNFPGCPYRMKFKFNVDTEDPDVLMRAARLFYDMGGDVDADQLRSALGLEKPTKDSSILRRSLTQLEAGELANAGSNNDKVEKGDDESEEADGEDGETATKIDAIKQAINQLGANAKAGDVMSALRSKGLSVSQSLIYNTLREVRGLTNMPR